jgi:hypothetical protein
LLHLTGIKGKNLINHVPPKFNCATKDTIRLLVGKAANGISGAVAILLRLLVKGKVTKEDVEKARRG